ncbi:MAG: hypothetical protein RI894_1038 [Bacteroidota bacterium]|jgi:hypothetical protein
MKYLFTILLLVAFANLHAQDLITTRKGLVIKAKVTEVTPTEIKYKRFDNLDGPNYTAKKSEIASIVYQNGTVDAFAEAETAVAAEATTSAADKPAPANSSVQNEITLGLSGGISAPFAYARPRGGNVFGLDFGSNFKGSHFGWLLTCFLGYHQTEHININTTEFKQLSGGTFSNSGILLGATYNIPFKNRSALIFSLQVGSIGVSTPPSYSYIQTGDINTPATYQSVQTNKYDGQGSGFLFDLGASYRLHIAKTHFYMLGKADYQGAGINVSSQGVNVITTTYDPVAGGFSQQSINSTNSFSYPYSAFNLQLGFGFFLNKL